MYDETDDDDKRKHTVAQIAAELGVSRPTIYRHLAKTAAEFGTVASASGPAAVTTSSRRLSCAWRGSDAFGSIRIREQTALGGNRPVL